MCFKEHNRIRIASIYPHTCTSWFDCMIFFSMDPLFDLAKYAMQVCFETFPTWAPHKLSRSREEKKAILKMPWWGNKHLSDLRVPSEECMWTMLSLIKKISKLLRCENGMRWLCFRAVPFLNRSRRYVSNSTYPAGMRYVLE